jgi:tol-pal system protein YbgF
MKIRILVCLFFLFLLVGCVTSDEMNQVVRRQSMATNQELNRFRAETDEKIAALTKETDNLRKQMINLSSSFDGKTDDIKTILGKLDELQHQLDTYWSETKRELGGIRKGGPAAPGAPSVIAPVVKDDSSSEVPYKDAFETFQREKYDEAVKKFTAFLESYPKAPRVPNAYFWLGESYIMLGDYDKAIVSFQVLVEKHSKSEMAPKALLSQAAAFEALKDKKSSITVLKRVIELFPKTEEAAIAERKLRSLNL